MGNSIPLKRPLEKNKIKVRKKNSPFNFLVCPKNIKTGRRKKINSTIISV
jgi:hypothetical protein